MKERIFEILHNRQRMPGEHFSDVEGKIEELVNQEVEKRIAERMPSEREISTFALHTWMDATYYHTAYKTIEWLRSILTSSEKPNNHSQKTEGGEG